MRQMLFSIFLGHLLDTQTKIPIHSIQHQEMGNFLHGWKTYFGVEENFRSKKPLITNINIEWFLVDGVNSFVMLDVFVRLRVVLVEFFRDIWTHVTIFFLDGLGCFQ